MLFATSYRLVYRNNVVYSHAEIVAVTNDSCHTEYGSCIYQEDKKQNK